MAALAGNHLLAPPLPRKKPPPIASTFPHLLRLRLRTSALFLSNSTIVFASLRTFAFSRFGSYIEEDDEEEEETEDVFHQSDDDEEYDGGGGSAGRVDEALDLSLITGQNVRLIDHDQKMIGVVSKSAAQQKAQEAGLDLVIVSLDADPPVVKIVDYDKYRYQGQRKKKQQQRKGSGVKSTVKELKLGYKIDVHDYGVRLRAAEKFLRSGHKVKVIVNLKRQAEEFSDMAIELLERFEDDIGELAILDTKNLKESNVFMILAPNKVAAGSRKRNEPRNKKEKLREKNVSEDMSEDVSEDVSENVSAGI